MTNWITKYYRTQTFIDIGWKEFSWFNDSLIEMMAIVYLLEKSGVIVEGTLIYFILVGAFIFFYIFGKILKATGVYDISEYVGATIDPVQKEILEAARIIKDKLGG